MSVPAGLEVHPKGHSANVINHRHIQDILTLQVQALRDIRSSREALLEFNSVYGPKLVLLNKSFAQHAKLLRRLTADFQEIFSRIRVCRQRVDRAIGRPTSRPWDVEQADEDGWSSEEEEEEEEEEDEELEEELEEAEDRARLTAQSEDEHEEDPDSQSLAAERAGAGAND